MDRLLPALRNFSPEDFIHENKLFQGELRSAEREKLWQEAHSALSPHVNNFANSRNLFNNAIGVCFTGNVYDQFSIKRVETSQCTFENCSFRLVAATGSTFSDSSFINCCFDGSNFQFANFKGAKFLSSLIMPHGNCSIEGHSTIIGASFNCSNLSESLFDNVIIKGSNFSNCIFDDTKIRDCHIQTSTFEGAVFNRSMIENLILRTINIEYADFTGANLRNVQVALMQLPYIFGAMDLYYAGKGISVDSEDLNNYPDGILPRDKFDSLLPHLEFYYEYMHEFFPLASIYLARGDKNNFERAINMGIRLAIARQEIRNLKFFCKLAKISSYYNNGQLHELYSIIENLINEYSANEVLMHQFKMHEGEIRSYLLPNQPVLPTVTISVTICNEGQTPQTNIAENIIRVIHKTLSYLNFPTNCNRVTISRNSPEKIIFDLIADKTDSLSFIMLATTYMLGNIAVKLAPHVLEFMKYFDEKSRMKAQEKLLESREIISTEKIIESNVTSNHMKSNNITNSMIKSPNFLDC